LVGWTASQVMVSLFTGQIGVSSTQSV
jgi:hypothetical protein